MSAAKEEELLANIPAAGDIRYEWLIRRPDGSRLVVDAKVNTILMDEAKKHLVHWRDITVRKMIEDKLHLLNVALENKMHELEKANSCLEEEIAERRSAQEALRQSRDELLAGETQLKLYAARLAAANEELAATNIELKSFANIVAHDFRTPMVNLKGFSGELETSLAELRRILKDNIVHVPDTVQRQINILLDSEIPDALSFIDSSVDRLSRMVDALLQLSRIGRREMNYQTIDMNSLVSEVLASYRKLIEDKNIAVRVGILPQIRSDIVATEQIIGNLVDNALKYLVPGRPGTIAIDCLDRGNEYLFWVEDNGRGVAADDLEKIFDLFRRAGRQDVPGEGMGLACVRTLVRQLGWENLVRIRTRRRHQNEVHRTQTTRADLRPWRHLLICRQSCYNKNEFYGVRRAEMNYNPRVITITTPAESRARLAEIGCDPQGIQIMTDKALFTIVKLQQVPAKAANLLKQTFLAKGGEVALARGSADLSVSCTDVLICATAKHYRLALAQLKMQPWGLPTVATAIESALATTYHYPQRDYSWPGCRLAIRPGRTLVMGILNITPDSFSDGGRYNGITDALRQADRLIAEGADILDIGAESTRPYGSREISVEEEMERLLPILEKVVAFSPIPISVDTYKSQVADAALKAGAHIINDVWGLQADPAMARVAAAHNAPVIIMHNQKGCDYAEDIIASIGAFLYDSIRLAAEAGLAFENLIIDPGIGFGKTPAQNLTVLSRLAELKSLGCPILLGTSRKRFIGEALGGLPVDEREEGTAASVSCGILSGASIVRVHDVKIMVRVARMTDAIKGGKMDE